MVRSWNFGDRVERAFYDYGRLCSAHPTTCLSISIITILFLSYPPISKLSIPISSPMDVYWSQKEGIQRAEENSAPEWLHFAPTFYIQQIIIKSTVEPWFGNLSAESAVRGAIAQSFTITKQLESNGFDSLCFRGDLKDSVLSGLLNSQLCGLLSPSLLWSNNISIFSSDQNIVNTIFRGICSPQMCPRDILLGTPIRLTGIKHNYRTNRHRQIDYAITLIQRKFDAKWREDFSQKLSAEFNVCRSHAFDEETFTHVFYRPRKYLTDYLPLLASYFLCAVYFYFTVSKFEMVKSKYGLALASFMTVFTTLTSTAGICEHFELNASLWRASVFPYMAMIMGLENVLCITRSVVYTPPSLDVASRLSHGLSHEGRSITKFFLLEIFFLSIGYLTQVPQIQEFCVFAFIGIVVDLYTQLFFYVPCLTFDLYRMDRDDKRRFSLMLFNTDIRKLKHFPSPTCPARSFLPFMFIRKHRLLRTLSEMNISDDGSSTITYRGQRRASGTLDRLPASRSSEAFSNRLRILYFWTKTRFIQRFLMAFFCVWVLWLGFIVHKWRVFEGLAGSPSNGTASRAGFWISQHYLDTAPLEWGDWQRHTFKWWPSFFAEYNLSLSGHYITFVPPIVLTKTVRFGFLFIFFQISADDPILIPKALDPLNSFAQSVTTENPELRNRVYFLERQMTTILLFSTFIPFSIVMIFTLYACFWDKWTNFRDARRSAAVRLEPKTFQQKGFVDLTPMAFCRHQFPVECLAVESAETIVSASVNGRLCIWDGRSGELRNSLVRLGERSNGERSRWGSMVGGNGIRQRFDSTATSYVPSEPRAEEPIEQKTEQSQIPKPLIWSLAIRHNIIGVGCSNGYLYLADSVSGNLVASLEQLGSGIVHLEIRGNRLIVIRLNGILETYKFSRMDSMSADSLFAEITLLSSSRVHKKPVTKLLCTTLHIITASSDHSLRIFSARSMHLSHTLNGHSAPIVSVCVDNDEENLFSSCESGRICCWALNDGQLRRTVECDPTISVEISVTSEYLVAFGFNTRLWLWDLSNGHPVANIFLNEQTQPLTLLLDVDEEENSMRGGRFLSVLSDRHIATSDFDSVQLWDLTIKAVIKQVRMPSAVDSLQRLDSNSALCCCGGDIFRISVPMDKASA